MESEIEEEGEEGEGEGDEGSSVTSRHKKMPTTKQMIGRMEKNRKIL